MHGYTYGDERPLPTFNQNPDKSRETELGRIGFYVGLADELLERDRNRQDMEWALEFYHLGGVLHTAHAERKLKKYANKSSGHRARLVTMLNNLGF